MKAVLVRSLRELERAALRALFQEAGGDFERMAEIMTGSRREVRAVRLRFNKVGLSARGERGSPRLRGLVRVAAPCAALP